MTEAPIDGHVTINGSGLEIHYRDWGGPSVAEGGGAPVVMLHGLASTSHIYDLCAPILAQSRRVVAYDQRGHGETAKPEDGYENATFVSDGVDLVEALRLETPYIVVGHSWGATVALEWAAHHPDQLRAVVLVDGAIFPFREAPGATWEQTAERLAPPDLSGVLFEDLLGRTQGSLGFLDETFRRAYFGAILQVMPDGTIKARLPRDKHLRILRSMWDTDVDALVARLRCPALALLAERTPDDAEGQQMEQLRRSMAERLQAAQPQLEVRWWSDTIHDVPLQRPALLAEAIAEMDRTRLESTSVSERSV